MGRKRVLIEKTATTRQWLLEQYPTKLNRF